MASGHVIFSRGATLLAAPINLARLEVTGPVAPIVEGVASELSTGGVHVALADFHADGVPDVPAPYTAAQGRIVEVHQ